MPLPIAQYLTEPERQAMVEAHYDITHQYGRRTVDYYCPLGVALRLTDAAWRRRAPCPTAFHVGQVLGRLGRGRAEDIMAAASEFMHQWDRGGLDADTLPDALGLA
jgi:hypothetical protein